MSKLDDKHNRGESPMVNAISNVTQTPPVAQPTRTSTQKPAQSEPQPATRADSVQLSKAAQALVAAQQEATEAPAQTAKEGGSGDLQAQRLLAKEASAKAIFK